MPTTYTHNNAVQATGGTQRNEFAAAIKSVTSSTTVGAVFLYSTKDDSDGGAWRKKCKGLSWFDEPTLPAGTGANQWNSATRSARSEFPAMALIVADNVTNDTLSIYDLDDVAAPLWLQISAGSSSTAALRSLDISSIYALNGRVYLGASNASGLFRVSFVGDTINQIFSSDRQRDYLGPIATRGDSLGYGDTYAAGGGLVNDTINDVSATVLEGAELGALGLPIPTVAVATNGGVSVIHANGDVYNLAAASSAYRYTAYVDFTENKRLVFGMDTSANSAAPRFCYNKPIPYVTNLLLNDTTSNSTDKDFSTNSSAFTPNVGFGSVGVSKRIVADGFDAFATTSGLVLVKRNAGNFADSYSANITSTYNTGYMVGDIRFAGLANSDTEDRCVKDTALSRTGTIDEDSADGGTGELKAYSGFTADDYLGQDSNTDFDFGTGDFSVMFWHKLTQASVDSTSNPTQYEDTISRTDATSEAGDWLIQKQPDESLLWKRHDGSSWVSIKTSSANKVGTGWTLVCAVRRNGVFNWYYNGVYDSSVADTNSYTPSGGSALAIGRRLDASFPATGASLALLRISATAPTPAQIKAIYDAEKVLFRSGAKCLLADNQVNDLAYDKTSGLLYVADDGANAGLIMRGLENVQTLKRDDDYGFASNYPVDTIVAAGGVSAVGRVSLGAGVNLPALDVRAELLESATKLPDDGKLHFEASVYGATPTVIGFIPMAENEWYSVRARVTSIRHNNMTASAYHTTTIEETFYRIIGGDINSRGQISKLTDEITASLDFDLTTTTALDDSPSSVAASSNYIMLRVTGYSELNIQWKASVEVQRISDKTYER